MSTLKTAGKVIVCVLFFCCTWIINFIICGVVGSFYYDGSNEVIGAIYGFTMLIFPVVASTLETQAFYKKWKLVQHKKNRDALSGSPTACSTTQLDTSGTTAIAKDTANISAEADRLPNRIVSTDLDFELYSIDHMEGHEFEYWCAEVLRSSGFSEVTVTPGSGDQGVDILAQKDGIKYAIQCKCYSSNLGNTPIQEVTAGKSFYQCHVGVVMTNQYFTPKAKELASATGTLLWDRDWITHYLEGRNASKKITSQQAWAEARTVEQEILEQELLFDEMLIPSVEVILETRQASVSMLQRRLKLGYARAACIMDQIEKLGIVGPFSGSTPRKILVTPAQWISIRSQLLKQ